MWHLYLYANVTNSCKIYLVGRVNGITVKATYKWLIRKKPSVLTCVQTECASNINIYPAPGLDGDVHQHDDEAARHVAEAEAPDVHVGVPVGGGAGEEHDHADVDGLGQHEPVGVRAVGAAAPARRVQARPLRQQRRRRRAVVRACHLYMLTTSFW